jgi:dTDP-glucose pyrophosphorylase/mRNA-degrading endonuclease RelE of RelBE toxin-antitoxin system
MRAYREHLIQKGTTIKEALVVLNNLAKDAIAFVTDTQDRLIGALTDGDVRRGLIKGINIDEPVDRIIQKNPKYLVKGDDNIQKVIEYRSANFRILPVVDSNHKIVNVINFGNLLSYLPIDAVIMAGGRGSRLAPLTDSIPKPLLKIGQDSIIELNIKRLATFGIDDFWVTLNYLGDQIENHLGYGENRNINIQYVYENISLGTLGAVSLIEKFNHEHVLVTNSDILTNLDYEDFYLTFLNSKADMAVVTIPYKVNIPYAVLETTNGHIMKLKEKPSYTYYSNGGIYLMKQQVLSRIPNNSYYNATDLIEDLIAEGLKVYSYPLSGYWLDIGRHEDFEKAQKDIHYLKF